MALLWILALACVSEPEYGDALDGGGDTDVSDPHDLPEGVVLGTPLACEDPVPTVAYTEVGSTRGLQPGPDPRRWRANQPESQACAVARPASDGTAARSSSQSNRCRAS